MKRKVTAPGPRKCPRCGSYRVRRSRRRGLREKLILPLVGRLPYRCEDCDKRFLDRSAPPDDVSHSSPPRRSRLSPPAERTQTQQNATRA